MRKTSVASCRDLFINALQDICGGAEVSGNAPPLIYIKKINIFPLGLIFYFFPLYVSNIPYILLSFVKK